jgi:inner membrane protein
MGLTSAERSPGSKLGLAILIAALLVVPLFSVWFLVYDRQSQSHIAQASIAEGWGGPQTIAGPLLVIPYRTTISETVNENNRPVVRSRQIWQELTLSPETAELSTEIRPERRRRSIYEVVVYDASVRGKGRFAMPADLSRMGIPMADLALDRAELRFGVSDARGLGANPRISVAGRSLRLQPGGGPAATKGAGFFAWFDASALPGSPVDVGYAFSFRGNGRISLAPQAGETIWRIRSAWPHPSFQGGFLPAERRVSEAGFTAAYRIGNLALGQSLVSTGAPAARDQTAEGSRAAVYDPGLDTADGHEARISLMQPIDLYSRVNRATKYGFLFIGFTFLAFLMFDIIGGVRVSGVEYLMVGAALILFFVLLLAFAEVIGFAAAYVAASAAIVGLNTAYSAAVLNSWRRAGFIFALLGGLYLVLYILLSLEDFALLIGSLMLLAALAAVMYLTRNVSWGAAAEEQVAS